MFGQPISSQSLSYRFSNRSLLIFGLIYFLLGSVGVFLGSFFIMIGETIHWIPVSNVSDISYYIFGGIGILFFGYILEKSVQAFGKAFDAFYIAFHHPKEFVANGNGLMIQGGFFPIDIIPWDHIILIQYKELAFNNYLILYFDQPLRTFMVPSTCNGLRKIYFYLWRNKYTLKFPQYYFEEKIPEIAWDLYRFFKSINQGHIGNTIRNRLPIEFQANKKRIFKGLMTSVYISALVFITLYKFIVYPYFLFTSRWVIHIFQIGFILALIMGFAFTMYFVVLIFRKNPSLILEEDGFIDNVSFLSLFSPRTYQWDDVRSVQYDHETRSAINIEFYHSIFPLIRTIHLYVFYLFDIDPAYIFIVCWVLSGIQYTDPILLSYKK